MRENSLLVRISYEVENREAIEDKVRYKAHIAKGNREGGKYMICGGIYNKNGGMIIYEARNVEEAREVEINNILINRSGRKYKQTKKDIISIPKQLLY